MPLVKTINNSIFCWKNTESLEELSSLFLDFDAHTEKIEGFKSIERKKQYLTTRILVQEHTQANSIVKGKNNKPFLHPFSQEISFSHNSDYTILMTSNIPCGIDIQKPTEKTLKIKSKFINELDFCFESEDTVLLSKIWSCKEAAFKKFGEHPLFLKSNISILNAQENDVFETKVYTKEWEECIKIKVENLDSNFLSYTIN